MPIVQTPPQSSVLMARNIYDIDNNGEVDTVQALSWVTITNKPTAFPPLPHTHLISDVTGLSAALATFVTTTTLPAALEAITYTSAEIDNLLATKAPVIHFHDDRYYTKPYIDTVTSPSGIDQSLAVYEGTLNGAGLAHNHDERYYDKAYVDNILNTSNFVLVNDARYYTKAEVDQNIANAPFLTQPAAEQEFYTKSYIDAALATLGDGLFVFTQGSPSNVWNIDHELGRYPTINIVVSGQLTLAEVVYPDSDHITVTFTNAQSGQAYLT